MLEQVFLEGEFVASFQVVDMQRLRDETHGSSEAVLDGTILKWLQVQLTTYVRCIRTTVTSN